MEKIVITPNAQTAFNILQDNTIYEHDRWVDEVEIAAENNKTLYISELLIGHHDSAGDFYDQVVDRIAKLPHAEKPSMVVLGALMQGDFKHTQKPRRVTLEPEFQKMSSQFAEARRRVDQFLDLGLTVIYNMSPEDHRIAYDYTVEVFREMQNLAKEVGPASQDKMRAHPQWQIHLDFQNRVVLPYCLDKGRSLNPGEYYELWDRCQKGENLAPKDFIVTDDVNITINKDYHTKIRAYMGFSPEPQYQDPLKPASQFIENALANNIPIPDALVMQHNHELVGSSFGDTWLLSTGAAFEPRNFIETRGSKSDARGDISRRLNTTRRRVHAPSAVTHEHTDDGRDIFTIDNEKLNSKSRSLARTVVLLTCDHQIGSITARPDILLKEIDLFRQRVSEVGRGAIQMAGDMSHGRNYPDFPSESQSTGLMAMDSQLRFNERLWRMAFSDMTKRDWDKLQSIVIQPGNHEWNSGTDKWHGYSFVDNHRLAFEVMLARVGYSDQQIKERIKTFDAFTTPKGEVARAFTGIERYGDYGFLNQHFLLARGGKGSGGGSPIYQVPEYVNGLADLAKNIDLYGVGHWHHGAFGLFGDKLGFIAPAKAGQSGYETWRGYRPGIGSLMIHIGGGAPVQLEFVPESTLHNHKIKKGDFANPGFKDDRGHNPQVHGLREGNHVPKSGLQKAVLQLEQDISQRKDTMGRF